MFCFVLSFSLIQIVKFLLENRGINLFFLQPLQSGHLSKANKKFCPVRVCFREVPLYLEIKLNKKLLFWSLVYLVLNWDELCIGKIA